MPIILTVLFTLLHFATSSVSGFFAIMPAVGAISGHQHTQTLMERLNEPVAAVLCFPGYLISFEVGPVVALVVNSFLWGCLFYRLLSWSRRRRARSVALKQ